MTFRLNGEFSFVFEPCLESDSTSPNPVCQMISSFCFRMEQENFDLGFFCRATNEFLTASTTTRTVSPSDSHLEDLLDEPQDNPGKLKRVNIRHSSV
jgi:hypothetical protein